MSSDDSNPCSVDTCVGRTCYNTMSNDCCGNHICEAGESNCSDCGPFPLHSGRCVNGCLAANCFMFDVVATNDVLISALTFSYLNGSPCTYQRLSFPMLLSSWFADIPCLQMFKYTQQVAAIQPNIEIVGLGKWSLSKAFLVHLVSVQLWWKVTVVASAQTHVFRFLAWVDVTAEFTEIPLSAGSTQR